MVLILNKVDFAAMILKEISPNTSERVMMTDPQKAAALQYYNQFKK